MAKQRAGGGVPPETVEQVERDSRVFFSLMVRAMDELGATVSPAALHALLVLEEIDSCSVGELAGLLPLSQSATSRMVDKLVSAGMLRREASPLDRRQVQLSATTAGRRLARRLISLRRQAIHSIATSMADPDLDLLRRGLHRFAVSAHPTLR